MSDINANIFSNKFVLQNQNKGLLAEISKNDSFMLNKTFVFRGTYYTSHYNNVYMLYIIVCINA